jgi:hypothetical protein
MLAVASLRCAPHQPGCKEKAHYQFSSAEFREESSAQRSDQFQHGRVSRLRKAQPTPGTINLSCLL